MVIHTYILDPSVLPPPPMRACGAQQAAQCRPIQGGAPPNQWGGHKNWAQQQQRDQVLYPNYWNPLCYSQCPPLIILVHTHLPHKCLQWIKVANCAPIRSHRGCLCLVRGSWAQTCNTFPPTISYQQQYCVLKHGHFLLQKNENSVLPKMQILFGQTWKYCTAIDENSVLPIKKIGKACPGI